VAGGRRGSVFVRKGNMDNFTSRSHTKRRKTNRTKDGMACKTNKFRAMACKTKKFRAVASVYGHLFSIEYWQEICSNLISSVGS